jgi:heme A synthase
MKLTPPKNITFWICVVLGFLALLAFTGTLTLLPIDPFWLAFGGLVLLIVALLVRDL